MCTRARHAGQHDADAGVPLLAPDGAVAEGDHGGQRVQRQRGITGFLSVTSGGVRANDETTYQNGRAVRQKTTAQSLTNTWQACGQLRWGIRAFLMVYLQYSVQLHGLLGGRRPVGRRPPIGIRDMYTVYRQCSSVVYMRLS